MVLEIYSSGEFVVLEKTKKQLIRLLSEADSSVIALSGKWGTGKTHLWLEVKKESSDEKVKNALYVSLFGLSSVDQIKRKLIEMAIPGVESHGGVFDGIKSFFNVGVKALSAHYKALAAINDMNLLLMAPVVLRKKVIVIDDIERKHDKLGVDEVLGFIDEYSKQHGSQFILVLNEDQLSEKENQERLWATFREKVIDHELRLSTSSEEAFSVAIGLVPSSYEKVLKRASISCGLTNIRIIVKVIKVVNRILGGRELEEPIQARIVPSIVLFSSIYYRGLNNGPDFKFALNIGAPDWMSMGRDTNEEPTEDEAREDRWRMLIHELGIHGCDDFEKLLVEFLESGLYDADKIESIIDGYVAEKRSFEARDIVNKFVKLVYWDHRVSDDQLISESALIMGVIELLDPFTVTELYDALMTISGGEGIAEVVINKWISAFKVSDLTNFDDENLFNRPLHPNIKAEFSAIKAKAQASTTVFDACMHIIENRGWDTLQEVAMRNATAADFETSIRGMEPDQLRRFLRRMIEMRLQRATYDPYFGSATERFVEACRNITNDTASPRLAGMVKRLFEVTSLSAELASEVVTKEQ
jgi:hypothetical protein